MKSHLYDLLLLVSSFTFFLLINQLLAHSLFHVHHHPGIPTNVAKHIYFSNFTPNYEMKLLGSASISQDKALIQIPDPSPAVDHAYQAGRAIYSSPIRLFDPLTDTPASFQTTFSFQFTTTNNSFSAATGGSGLAFVIVPDEFTVGRPGPWLGIINDACEHYKVFAVEFDNRKDPTFGDPNDDHVGINLGTVVSFKTANSSQSKVSLHDNLIHRAWILYDGDRKWIQIYLGVDGDPVPSHPLISSSLNLSPFLKEYMFVGFSASTADSLQIHNILSWDFSSTSRAMLSLPPSHVCQKNIAHQVSKYSTTNHTDTPSSFMVFMCLLGLCSVTLLNLYCNRQRSSNRESYLAFVFPDKKQRPLPPSKPRRFESPELYKATKCFSKMEVLASNARGVLYRGKLTNGGCVAVKRFSNEFLSLSRLDWSRVLKRISLITQVSHPSLAQIRGWCCDNRESIIVYDYFQNGSLDRWLFGVGVLSWSRRFMLIKDIAESLSFLHSKELTHGNLKSSSVFIDINYRAVLGDYGFMDSVSSKKADVFGFGMLVLEIVSARRTELEQEIIDILRFAWAMHEKGEIVNVIDDRMKSNLNVEQAIRVLEIGLACTLCQRDTGIDGPSMEEVGQFLNMKKPIPKLLAEMLSKNYNSLPV